METVPSYPISQAEAQARQLFTELQPGDRVEATHQVIVGLKRWTAKRSARWSAASGAGMDCIFAGRSTTKCSAT